MKVSTVFHLILGCFPMLLSGQVPDKYNYPDTLWIYGQSEHVSYGFTPENPVRVGGGVYPKHIYRYLNNLTDSSSNPLSYKRIGSCCSSMRPSGKPLITFKLGEDENERQVYFDGYTWDSPQLLLGFGWHEKRIGYQGEYINDSVFHGQGIYFFEDGGYYKGQFEHGLMNGRGEMFVPDEERYVGEFLDGRYHGFGTLFYKDGGRYEGEWVDFERHGKGKIYFPPTSEINYMEGVYENDEAVGVFIVVEKDGTTYEQDLDN